MWKFRWHLLLIAVLLLLQMNIPAIGKAAANGPQLIGVSIEDEKVPLRGSTLVSVTVKDEESPISTVEFCLNDPEQTQICFKTVKKADSIDIFSSTVTFTDHATAGLYQIRTVKLMNELGQSKVFYGGVDFYAAVMLGGTDTVTTPIPEVKPVSVVPGMEVSEDGSFTLKEFSRPGNLIRFASKVNPQTAANPIEGYSLHNNELIIPKSAVKSVKEGDVLLLAGNEDEPFGMAKAVVALVERKQDYVIQTLSPQFEEVFAELDVSKFTSVSGGHFRPNPQFARNIEVVDYSKVAWSNSVKLKRGDINISRTGFDIKLNDLYIPGTGNNIKVNGTLAVISPNTDVALKWKALGLNLFRSIAKFNEQSGFTITAFEKSKKASSFNKMKFAHNLTLGQLIVPISGPLGLLLDVHVIFDGDLNAKLKYTLAGGGDRTIGTKFKEDEFNFVNDSNYKTSSIDASGNGTVMSHMGAGVGLYTSVLQYKLGGVAAEAGVAGAVNVKSGLNVGAAAGNDDPSKSCFDTSLFAFARLKASLNLPPKIWPKPVEFNPGEKQWPIGNVSTCVSNNFSGSSVSGRVEKVTLAASVNGSSISVGRAVTFTATAKGSPMPRYLFIVKKIGEKQVVVQNYSGDNTYVWKPISKGTYAISVFARDRTASNTVQKDVAYATRVFVVK